MTDLLSALLGSVIGGLFVLAGTIGNHYLDSQKRQRDEKATVKAFLKAIHSEIGELLDRHMEAAGKYIEELPEGEILDFEYETTEHYFSVFEANAGMLGRVQDDELRNEIIRTYIKAKGLLDGFRINNRNLNTLSDPDRSSPIPTSHIKELMADYGKSLQQEHYELKTSITSLKASLEKATTAQGQ